jgi:cytochrome c5
MRTLAFLAALATLGTALAADRGAAAEEDLRLADAPGRDLTVGSCITCHSVDYISMNAPVMDKARWEKTVAKMIDKYGAPIDKASVPLIVDYLTANYSAAPSP